MGGGTVAGVDIGGTKILVGLVEPDGRVAHRALANVPPGAEPDRVIAKVAEMIDTARSQASSPVEAVGVGVAGQVDLETGLVWFAPNLRWRDVPLAAPLAHRLRIPVGVENDARAIALGEWSYGGGRGSQNFLTLCVGTGLGGGVVVDGRLLGGYRSAAGEVGHVTLVVGGRPCHCPNRGCFEAYVSGWAIAERLQEAGRSDVERVTALRRHAGPMAPLTAAHLSEAVGEGDPFAREFVAQLGAEFSAGVVGLVNAFNPERVVVGGKVAEGLPVLIDAAQRAVAERCQPPAAGATVTASPLGSDAGILGGAAIARAALDRRSAR